MASCRRWRSLLCQDTAALPSEPSQRRDISDRLTASCRAVDPASTDEVIQYAHAADVVEGETPALAQPAAAETATEAPGPAFDAGVFD